MVHTKVCCDRCGNAILEGRTKLVVECGPPRSSALACLGLDAAANLAYDFCRDCEESFQSWRREPSAKEAIR